jgi:DAK2 domain fusion protein YloV
MEKLTTEAFIEALKSAQANLENNKQSVNDLNVFPVPDGDTGTNMSLTMQYAVKEAAASRASLLGEAVSASSNGALMGARGNSGVILSQLFRGFSKSANGLSEFDSRSLAKAMRAATNMAYKAVMKPTEGTILTVAREMADRAEELCEKEGDLAAFLSEVIVRGRIALENTPNQLAVLKEAGVVDSGGQGLILLLEGALRSLQGNPVQLGAGLAEGARETTFLGEEIPDILSDIEFGFCTEFLIAASEGHNYEKFLIDKLVKLGDSLLVIQDGAIIKIHVHTNEPWTAMKIVAGCGEIQKIKIDNMRRQHRELFEGDQALTHPPMDEAASHAQFADAYIQAKGKAAAHSDYYIIAVSSGDGLTGILKDLGVHCIIEGGQTMNPSTEDFLSAIDAANAESFLLLPNNKNIIMAASQAAKMAKKNAHVIESRSIPQAISAMMEFNAEEELGNNLERMKKALKSVKTAEVTYAVRDTKMGKTAIRKGDAIAVVDGKMSVAEKSIEKAAAKAVESLSPGADLITLYYGADVSDEDAERLAESLRASLPGVDVEMIMGGQPVYYYIISAE